jgi:hypothetical protein
LIPRYCEQLVERLDMLGVLAALEDNSFYENLKEHRTEWLKENASHVPNTLEEYQTQLIHSVFLLGYGYFEAFLNDVARGVLLAYPRKLSNREWHVHELFPVLEDEKRDLKGMLIDKELRNLFGQSLPKTIKHLEDKLDVPITKGSKPTMIEASQVRNLLIHNGGFSPYALPLAGIARNSQIRLTSTYLHEVGTHARTIAAEIRDHYRKAT